MKWILWVLFGTLAAVVLIYFICKEVVNQYVAAMHSDSASSDLAYMDVSAGVSNTLGRYVLVVVALMLVLAFLSPVSDNIRHNIVITAPPIMAETGVRYSVESERVDILPRANCRETLTSLLSVLPTTSTRASVCENKPLLEVPL